MDGAALQLALRKLSNTGTVLYVGAHPDDENTSLLALLSKGRMVRTVYLSLTRGDGGQNLIGSDTGERLGVLRTQELLAARRVDGAEQWFTQALDFGFSKNPKETLEKWGPHVLSDVVWAIRVIQPDVIVTRFHPDSTNTHGHHTASAILAEQAFVAAADSTRFPEQFHNGIKPWRTRRLMCNVARFGNAGPDTTAGRLHIDLGAYDRLLGRSYTEIAGESRSMHKTQGFGSAERRGRLDNTLENRLGERASKDLLEGLDLTWARVPGGAKLIAPLRKAADEFDAEHPERTLPTLLEAWDVMGKLPDRAIVREKRAELLDAIRACAGLWLEAVSSTHTVSPGSSLKVAAAALLRAPVAVRWLGIDLESNGSPVAHSERPGTLENNLARAETLSVTMPANTRPTHPYWLEHTSDGLPVLAGLTTGQPENPPVMLAKLRLEIAKHALTFTLPVVYRWVDPVLGERYRDLAVGPPATLRFGRVAYLFPDATAREVTVTVLSTDRPTRGAVSLRLPSGWRAEPASIDVALRGGEADTTVRFRVTPGPAGPAVMNAVFENESGRWDRSLVRLDYPHLPVQTLWPQSEAHLVRTDLRTQGQRIAYLMGSGDQVPEALRQMGFDVTLLEDDDLERRDLSTFDAVVVGVRAYNTRPRLRRLQPRLIDYARQGGRLVIQYQTPDPALDDKLGPYPFKVSRDRVTVEEAEVRFTDPNDPVLNFPNKIGPRDFDGWVQERGLWYANPWDKSYRAVLSMNDPGEPPLGGGLIAARVGKGAFFYTGLAFFRQLPAGVPGAWRLFANLVSREGDGAPVQAGGAGTK
jgi:LmbE family N-acetylglucosaminyl deacetylase